MQDNQRVDYSPDREGRRAIGYDRERRRDDDGRFMPEPYNRYIDDRPEPYIRYDRPIYASRTIRGSGSFEMAYPRHGGAEGVHKEEPIDEQTARQWVQRMDGGEHFKPQQADDLRRSVGARCNPYTFYVALNMMHSDYARVAQQMGVDRPEFYAHMAKAFVEDTDARDGKVRRYMEGVAGGT